MKYRFQIPFLLLFVVAAFSPAIWGEFLTIDDEDMIAALAAMDHWSLKELFFPGGGGLYYRPLLMLTFYLDKELWGLHPLPMHLENLFLHAINALLVYLLASRVTSLTGKDWPRFPLVCGLLFGLHPLAVESVAWVSGRTDVLAGTFVLSGAVLILEFKRSGRRLLLVPFALSALAAMMSKEVAVSFAPGAFLLLAAGVGAQSTTVRRRFAWKTLPWGKLFLAAGGASVLIAAFYFIRTVAISANNSRIGTTLLFIFNDLYHFLFVCLRAFGFYFKKIFIPYPLNFAILEVDPLYELLAIALVVLCLWLLLKRGVVGAIFLCGAFLITPSFVIAMNQIAWTPYAERYAYIPAAFVILSTSYFLRQKAGEKTAVLRWGALAAAGLICMAGFSSLHRSYVFQSNLRLWENVVQNNPNFAIAINDYGKSLYNVGRLQEAKQQFARAASLYSLFYTGKYDLNLARVHYDLEEYDQAEKVFNKVLEKTEGGSSEALEGLVTLKEIEIQRSVSDEDLSRKKTELLDLLGQVYEVSQDPSVLVEMGRLAGELGKVSEAVGHFRLASAELPEGDPDLAYAREELTRLGQ